MYIVHSRSSSVLCHIIIIFVHSLSSLSSTAWCCCWFYSFLFSWYSLGYIDFSGVAAVNTDISRAVFCVWEFQRMWVCTSARVGQFLDNIIFTGYFGDTLVDNFLFLDFRLFDPHGFCGLLQTGFRVSLHDQNILPLF